MKTNNVIFLLFVLAIVPRIVVADARTDAAHALDSQIMELERTRDELRAKLNTCEDKQKKNKIAGITTLATTGAGVVGNVLLHKSIQKKESSGGSGSKIGQDNRPPAVLDCDPVKGWFDQGFSCDDVIKAVPNYKDTCEKCK